jgi:cytosine/adenosine deaminase-related metal-dependent hydrolase
MIKHNWLFLLYAFSFLSLSAGAQQHITHVDYLIKGTTIVDPSTRTVKSGMSIAVKGKNIVAIAEDISGYTANNVIDGSKLITLPGFVNTHTHLWQHICKSCSPKESLQKWISIYRKIHPMDSLELYKVVFAASSEALLSGITTVSDYASLSFNDFGFRTNANAMKDAGLGGVLVWHNPSIFLPDRLKEKEILKLTSEYKGIFDIWMGAGPLSFHPLPQVYSGISLGLKLNMHFTEHTMENNMEQPDLYDSLKKYFDLHQNQLSRQDADFIKDALSQRRPSYVTAYEQLIRNAVDILKKDSLLRSRKTKGYKPLTSSEQSRLQALTEKRAISPMTFLEYFGCLNDFLSIHSVWQEPEDIKLMNRYHVSVSHNPESNLYLSSGIAPVQDYLLNEINVSIGTDGGASNDGINFFSAMRESWNMAKLKALNTDISKNLDAWDILEAATIGGARALKINDKTGSISVGKEADLVLISSDELGMTPFRTATLPSLIINSANTRNVSYVFSDGVLRVNAKQLTGKTERQSSDDLTTVAAAVDQRVDSGKIWAESSSLNNQTLIEYWYRYRSIRKQDSVNVELKNLTGAPLKITVCSSANTFGGGTAYVASPEVTSRFPYDTPANSFLETFTLKDGNTINISKAKGIMTINIISDGITKNKTTEAGQLLILAEPLQ